MNANSLRLAARSLEAGGSLGAPGARKIAAYLAINREMTLFAAGSSCASMRPLHSDILSSSSSCASMRPLHSGILPSTSTDRR